MLKKEFGCPMLSNLFDIPYIHFGKVALCTLFDMQFISYYIISGPVFK